MKILFFLFSILITNYTFSQYFIEFQVGNSFPVFSNMSAPMNNGYHIENQDTSIESSDIVDINLGVGLSGSFILGKMFYDKKLSFSLSGFYSNSSSGYLKNQTIYEYYDFSYSMVNYQLWKKTFYGQKIMMTPKVNYYMFSGKLKNSIGIGATFALVYVNEIYNFKVISPSYMYAIEEKYKLMLKKGLGCSFLLEDKLLFQISENLFFNTTISFQPLQIETKGKRYFRKTVETTYNSYSEQTDKQTVDADHMYVFNFSAINISLGLHYSFGKKEKVAGE